MTRYNRSMLAMTLVAASTAFLLTGVLAWPYLVSQTTYAIEKGRAQASAEELTSANELSKAFREVSRALRPSVVSIRTVKRTSIAQPSAQRFNGDLPPEIRRFFGNDDLMERFFESPFEDRLQRDPPMERRGAGSGVIVTDNGYVLTNNHVIEGADEVTVVLSDNRQFKAEVVGGDKPTDVAVLKIDATGLYPAKLGDSSELQVGDWVLAMGSPFGLDQTVTAGIISATGRANVGITDYEDFLQTDASINPGNSGGPLVNLRGEVIGVNTAIASRSGGYQGIGFAIPSKMAKRVKDSIIQDGKVTRGFLGAMIQDLTPELAESFDYNSTRGVLIGDVVKDGPAYKAGMKAGDIVTKFDGITARNANHFRNSVAATGPGETMNIELHRDGQPHTVTVTVGELDEKTVAKRFRQESATESRVHEKLGVTLETLTPALADEYGLDKDREAVVVTNVERGSLAANVGIQPGDIIASVNGESVSSTEGFDELMNSADLSQGLRLQIERDGVRRFVFMRNR